MRIHEHHQRAGEETEANVFASNKATHFEMKTDVPSRGASSCRDARHEIGAEGYLSEVWRLPVRCEAGEEQEREQVHI